MALVDQTAGRSPAVTGSIRERSGTRSSAGRDTGVRGAPNACRWDTTDASGCDANRSSSLSSALLVAPRHVVCFEQPAAAFRLAADMCLRFARFPRFDLKHSVLEWTPSAVERRVDLDVEVIAKLDATFEDIRCGRK